MLNISKLLTPHENRKVARPIVIDCISPIDLGFADTFRKTLDTIALELPVIVEFKRATLDDVHGLAAMVEALDERRTAGGEATFVTSTRRSERILRDNGVRGDLISVEGVEAARRTIILAKPSRPRVLLKA